MCSLTIYSTSLYQMVYQREINGVIEDEFYGSSEKINCVIILTNVTQIIIITIKIQTQTSGLASCPVDPSWSYYNKTFTSICYIL